MKFNLRLSVMFLLMINTALGAVGNVGISDMDTTNSYLTEQSGQASINQGSAYPAPQISGPLQEQMTAEQLGLSQPQMESFAPDESLGFISASQPSDAARIIYAPGQSSVPSSTSSYVQAALPGSSIWYYPSSLVSANRFYVQTASGLGTVGGCSFKGYLPLWADIKSSGNFFIYEWYPGQSTPSVRWWGWTGSGWKKGWFCGDVSGWHILCYNSGIWSNYIYIYVYPSTASLPLNAPNPPDLAAERIVLPDFNLYRPITDQSSPSGYSYPAQESAQLAAYPSSLDPALTSSSRQTCTTCTSSTVITGGVSSSYPYGTGCQTCAIPASQSAPSGYAAQSYQAVYPVPSVCKCNEYYVQSCPGRLATVAGVFCGSWLPLWSRVSQPGTYWSFEWTACSSGPGYYCSPDVKNFGYKSTGWYQTWFKANNPGWHILSYCCNDWSNYVYVYVWPAD